MVQLSSELLGQDVQLGTFQALEYKDAFDGVWACASLLHVPRAETHDVLARLVQALRVGGLLYASFKYGDQEGLEGERFFNRYNQHQLSSTIADIRGLRVERIWVTGDVRPSCEGEFWINLLARRVQ